MGVAQQFVDTAGMVTVVSQPSSSLVAPTTSSPFSRGTR